MTILQISHLIHPNFRNRSLSMDQRFLEMLFYKHTITQRKRETAWIWDKNLPLYLYAIVIGSAGAFTVMFRLLKW